MLVHEVAAAFAAKAADRHLATLVSTDQLRSRAELYVLFVPQGKRSDRRAAITTSVSAVAISHLQGRAYYFDRYRAAITGSGLNHGATVLYGEHPATAGPACCRRQLA